MKPNTKPPPPALLVLAKIPADMDTGRYCPACGEPLDTPTPGRLAVFAFAPAVGRVLRLHDACANVKDRALAALLPAGRATRPTTRTGKPVTLRDVLEHGPTEPPEVTYALIEIHSPAIAVEEVEVEDSDYRIEETDDPPQGWPWTP